jgi:steroid 5-alpha reductase family enzyme
MNRGLFDAIVISWIMLACVVCIVLLFITAPYGRHSSRKWGITIPNRTGWIMMEAPVLAIFLYFILSGKSGKNTVLWVMAALFCLHYIHRSMIYPFRIKTKGKRMPLLIALLAVLFNAVNGFINGYYLGTLQNQYNHAWLTDPRFIAGSLLFLTGMIINLAADEQLIRLRKNSANGYRIPYGILFSKISCPNFFGEILEWLGFAVLCWSLPALSFFVWTLCNLIPRALDHHRWYKKQFPDYPANRKAVLPYLL